jgi:hypothetical protein
MRLGFRHRRKPQRALRAGLALMVIGLLVAGCEEVPSNLVKSEPFKLEPVKGTDMNRVTLADETAARIDLQTVKVQGRGAQKTVPHNALIYNPVGQVFVYTRPQPRTYLRAPVEVSRVAGESVVLSKGPPVGTVVVTVGAAELLATEYEILNQHP